MILKILEEYIKCEKDFHYFSKKYLNLVFEDFILTKNNTIYITPRQRGKTTFGCAYVLWQSIFSGGYVGFIVYNLSFVKNTEHTFKKMVENLKQTPFGEFLSVFLEKRSSIKFLSSKTNLKGYKFSVLFLDEVDYFGNWDSEIISKSDKVIAATTPSTTGGNLDLFKYFDRIIVRSNLSKERLDEIKNDIGEKSFEIEYLGGIN